MERESADFGWFLAPRPTCSMRFSIRNIGNVIKQYQKQEEEKGRSASSTPTVTMSHLSDEGDWLQAMRLENQEVKMRCAEKEALIKSKVGQKELILLSSPFKKRLKTLKSSMDLLLKQLKEMVWHGIFLRHSSCAAAEKSCSRSSGAWRGAAWTRACARTRWRRSGWRWRRRARSGRSCGRW